MELAVLTSENGVTYSASLLSSYFMINIGLGTENTEISKTKSLVMDLIFQ